MNVGDIVRFDVSEFPFLGLEDYLTDQAELVIVDITPNAWNGLAVVEVEFEGKSYALLENAIVLW
jgi:hypothetical protein